jgi:hypothetical protein
MEVAPQEMVMRKNANGINWPHHEKVVYIFILGAQTNKPGKKQDAMKNKKDFRVDGKCTAETYADDCRCERGVVFGMWGCVFYDNGGECLNDKKKEDSSITTIENYDSRTGDDGYSDGGFEDCD